MQKYRFRNVSRSAIKALPNIVLLWPSPPWLLTWSDQTGCVLFLEHVFILCLGFLFFHYFSFCWNTLQGLSLSSAISYFPSNLILFIHLSWAWISSFIVAILDIPLHIWKMGTVNGVSSCIFRSSFLREDPKNDVEFLWMSVVFYQYLIKFNCINWADDSSRSLTHSFFYSKNIHQMLILLLALCSTLASD